MKRNSDKPMHYNPPCFRSERFILINQSWYFQVRESQPIGPFDCLNALRIAMKSYLDVVTPPQRYAHSHNSSIDCSRELDGLYRLSYGSFPDYSGPDYSGPDYCDQKP